MSDQIGMSEAEQAKVARKLKRAMRTKVTAPIEDPLRELRHLVRQDKALTKAKVAIHHMGSDRTALNDNPGHWEKGDTIPCLLPKDTQEELKAQCDAIDAKRKELEGQMSRLLRGVPVYELFLRRVFGLGTLTAAYLITEIDIRKCEKSSALRRFCGMAVIDGRLEGRSGAPKKDGGTGTYNQTLRTRLFLCFDSMRKAGGKNKTSKYLMVWADAKNRIANSERVVDRKVGEDGSWSGKIVNGQGKTVSAKKFSDSYGWHKAADVLVEDLYTVWRALEGLPVWPSYYAAKLGYEHGGKISVNAPRVLTVDQALELVGNVGPRARD